MDERFTIRGTASVIVERDGKLLLTKEYANKNPNNVIILAKPGGHIEEGESFAECAVREAFEETGYRVRLTSLVGIYQQRFTNGSSSVNVTYTGELLDETSDGPTEKDILEVVWMPVEEFKTRREEWRQGSTIPSFEDYFAGKRYPVDVIHWKDYLKTP